MSDSPFMQDLAWEQIQIEWEKASKTLGPPPSQWLVSEMVALIGESHDRPVYDLEPMIRRLIFEHQFVDDSGDAMPASSNALVQVDRQARLCVQVLEQVRLQALERGTWSDAPVTPLMCG